MANWFNRVITRQLYLLRHAKSDWDDPSVADHDRPLSARGRRAALSLAEHFRRAELRPMLVLCSSATRAVQTLDPISTMMGLQPRTRVEPDLYGATAEEILLRVQAVDDRVGSLLVVGHNPGLQDLTLELAGDDPEIAVQLGRGFPTGALAEIVSEGEAWWDLTPSMARVLSVTFPRDLRS